MNKQLDIPNVLVYEIEKQNENERKTSQNSRINVYNLFFKNAHNSHTFLFSFLF